MAGGCALLGDLCRCSDRCNLAGSQETDLGVTLAMAAAVYAILAGWFAMVALAVRRDVSVMYLVAPFAICRLCCVRK